MSTDHQQYSIDNQMQVISDYALSRGLEIVRTYSDAGRSGLSLQGRDALRHLLPMSERAAPSLHLCSFTT
jgi:DNA invertase Pin-like site-specific DNA recombinase